MALQSGYFEDWGDNPTVLLWGDATGMRELRDFLRSPLAVSSAATLDTICHPVDGRTIAVLGVSSERDAGMRLVRDRLEWKLWPELAEDYADKVDVLASSVSGHQYLETFSGGGIVVEVSRGEYPETMR
jgi:hypothetical protein